MAPTLDQEALSIVGGVDNYTLQQKVHRLEAGTCGCVEMPNAYDLYDADTGKRLMEVEEESSIFNRCCCAPNHSLKLNFHVVDQEGNRLHQAMTMERTGCLCKKPCLGCCAIFPFCSDKATFHVGAKEGKPGELDDADVFGHAVQPSGGGGFLTPTIHVMDRDGSAPKLSVTGPTCFGGCSELFCDTPFKAEDKLTITKMKPKDAKGALREMLTDSDTFSMQLHDKTLTPDTRMQLIGTIFLMDYMFFERDIDAFGCDDGLYVNLCNCYCCGLLCPCQCKCSGSGGDDSAEEGDSIFEMGGGDE